MRISIYNMTREDFQDVLDNCKAREYDGNDMVVQTSSISDVDIKTLELFNDMILSVYPNVTFRIYPESSDVDLDKIKHIKNLRCLDIEGEKVINTISIAQLIELEELELNISRIDGFEFLKELTNLKVLILKRTKILKPDLTNLKYLVNLEKLVIEKYKNGLDNIKYLKNLKKLYLYGQTFVNFDFLPNHELDYLSLNKIKSVSPIDSFLINAKQIFVDGKELNFIEHFDEVGNNIPLFNLTNHERKYLGLELVEDHWELVKLDDYTYIYFDNNKIKKRIYATKSRYLEESMNIDTENRDMLLPKTSKGKAKKLTLSNLESYKAHGVYVDFKLKIDNNEKAVFKIGNYTNQLSLLNYKFFDIPDFSSFDELRDFINKFIDDTTEENIEELDHFKNSKRKRIKYKVGDFFRVRIDRKGNYIYGRILLSLDELRKYEDFKKYKNYGLTSLMTVPVIVKTYLFVGGKDIDLYSLREKEALPTYITMDNKLLYGEYEIIGNLPLEEVDLQEMFIHYGRSISGLDRDTFYLQWGLIYLETNINNLPEHLRVTQYRDKGVGFRDGFENSKEFYNCLKANSNAPYWENKTYYKYDDLRNPIHEDLKNEIMEFFGLNTKLNYVENFKIWCKDKSDRDYLKNFMM